MGWRSLRKRLSSARISSSGVPMPTKPETHTVSSSRTNGDGFVGGNDLVLERHRLKFLSDQPLGDPGAEQGLRLAADEHADVSPGSGSSGVVLGCRLFAPEA